MGVSLHGRRHKSTTLLKSIFDSNVQPRANTGLKVIITRYTTKNRGHWGLHVGQRAAGCCTAAKSLQAKDFKRCMYVILYVLMVYMVKITATTLAVTGGGERVNFGCGSCPCRNPVLICRSRACRRSGRVPPTRPCIKPYIVGFDALYFLVFWFIGKVYM